MADEEANKNSIAASKNTEMPMDHLIAKLENKNKELELSEEELRKSALKNNDEIESLRSHIKIITTAMNKVLEENNIMKGQKSDITMSDNRSNIEELEKMVKEKEVLLESISKKSSEHQEVEKEYHDTILGKDKKIRELESLLERSGTISEEVEKEYHDTILGKDKKIGELESKLERRGKVSDNQKNIEELQDMVQENQNLIESVSNTNIEKEKKIKELEKMLEENQICLTECKSEVSKMNIDCSVKQDKIVELQKKVIEKHNLSMELKNNLSTVVAKHKTQISEKDIEIQQKEEQMKEILRKKEKYKKQFSLKDAEMQQKEEQMKETLRKKDEIISFNDAQIKKIIKTSVNGNKIEQELKLKEQLKQKEEEMKETVKNKDELIKELLAKVNLNNNKIEGSKEKEALKRMKELLIKKDKIIMELSDKVKIAASENIVNEAKENHTEFIDALHKKIAGLEAKLIKVKLVQDARDEISTRENYVTEVRETHDEFIDALQKRVIELEATRVSDRKKAYAECVNFMNLFMKKKKIPTKSSEEASQPHDLDSLDNLKNIGNAKRNSEVTKLSWIKEKNDQVNKIKNILNGKSKINLIKKLPVANNEVMEENYCDTNSKIRDTSLEQAQHVGGKKSLLIIKNEPLDYKEGYGTEDSKNCDSEYIGNKNTVTESINDIEHTKKRKLPIVSLERASQSHHLQPKDPSKNTGNKRRKSSDQILLASCTSKGQKSNENKNMKPNDLENDKNDDSEDSDWDDDDEDNDDNISQNSINQKTLNMDCNQVNSNISVDSSSNTSLSQTDEIEVENDAISDESDWEDEDEDDSVNINSEENINLDDANNVNKDKSDDSLVFIIDSKVQAEFPNLKINYNPIMMGEKESSLAETDQYDSEDINDKLQNIEDEGHSDHNGELEHGSVGNNDSIIIEDGSVGNNDSIIIEDDCIKEDRTIRARSTYKMKKSSENLNKRNVNYSKEKSVSSKVNNESIVNFKESHDNLTLVDELDDLIKTLAD